jgi:uncharacterized BrkB/YihY/UPF0761 family membrane protein
MARVEGARPRYRSLDIALLAYDRHRLAAGGLLAGATLLLAASAGANWLRLLAPGPGLWVVCLVGVVYFAIWLGASWLLPHAADAPWTAMVPGAVLFAVGIEALHLFTVLCLSREIAHASRTYGSLGVAVSLLGGLYLFGWLVVASAMLNASRWERSLQGRRDEAAS